MFSMALGLILFLGIHSCAIFAPDLRRQMVEKSAFAWKAFYSLLSVAGIALIAHGYAAARGEPVLLYVTPVWFRHITSLCMLFALILFVAPYLPGKIKQVTKHPQLVAVKLWAASHLLVNGMLADVVLFGAFLLWAVVDRVSMRKREQQPLPGLKPSGVNDIIAIVIGVGLTGAFVFYLHSSLIGMPLM